MDKRVTYILTYEIDTLIQIEHTYEDESLEFIEGLARDLHGTPRIKVKSIKEKTTTIGEIE